MQATPRFYLAAVDKNQEKASDYYYVTDLKWWTRLVRNVDLVRTNRVHHFRSMTVMIPGLLPIFLHGCNIKSGSSLEMRLNIYHLLSTCRSSLSWTRAFDHSSSV